MKRYCSIILILAMAVATFAGCKQDGASGKSQKEMVVITNTEQEQAVTDFAKYYMEKHQGVHIRVENPFKGSSEEKSTNLQKWNTDITVGKGPDVYVLSTLLDNVSCENEEEQLLIKNVNKAMQNGVFASLDTYMEKDSFWKQSDYKKEILEAGKDKEKQYVLPFTCHYYVIAGEEKEVSTIGSLQDLTLSDASNSLFLMSRWAQPAVDYEKNQVLFDTEKWKSIIKQCFENHAAQTEEKEPYVHSVKDLEMGEYESCTPLMNLDGKKVTAVECYGAVGMSSEYKDEAYEFLMLFLNGTVSEEKGTEGFDMENRVVSTGVPVMENNKYYQQYPQILASYQEIEDAYFPTLIDRSIGKEMEEWLYAPANDTNNIDLKCAELGEKVYKKYDTMIKE